VAWPYPGDAPLTRARKVALAYRARLADRAPEACASLDLVVAKWGETWATPQLHRFDPDEWLSARDAAELACVTTNTLRVWRSRRRLQGRRAGRSCIDQPE
jgi:hypothetical protein